MKNPVIFGLSNISTIRRGRQMLAPKEAGIFRLHEKQAICTCRAWSIMGHATRAVRLVFDSGKGRSLFICPVNIKHHHAHRNHTAHSAAHSTQTFSPTLAHPKQDGQATSAHGGGVPAFNAAIQADVRDYGAKELPASITIAAIPPAAFSTHYFLNLAQCAQR